MVLSNMGIRELTAVFLGGAAGTLARAGLVEAWPVQTGNWPWATFAVNVAGAFVLGLVVARGWNRALLGTGFCAALTTFSAIQLELLQMLDADRIALAAAYAGASLVAGLAAVSIAGRRRLT